MQILADVDESDIGFIRDSMPVRFTVQTYPEQEFLGKVSQIRLQPIKINNVVNYQVVVDVNNEKALLLPGMTANLEFVVNTTKNALIINNSALRFRPTQTMLDAIKPRLIEKAEKFLADSSQQKFKAYVNNEEFYNPANFKNELPSNYDGFFYTNESGLLDFQFIEVGIKSGLESEIKRFMGGKTFKDGDKAINSIKTKA